MTRPKKKSTSHCFECGRTGEIHRHHVVPQCKGGTKTVDLCAKCHGKVHDTRLFALREKGKCSEATKRKLQRLANQLYTSPEIACMLNEEGTTTPTGRKWNRASVVHALLYHQLRRLTPEECYDIKARVAMRLSLNEWKEYKRRVIRWNQRGLVVSEIQTKCEEFLGRNIGHQVVRVQIKRWCGKVNRTRTGPRPR